MNKVEEVDLKMMEQSLERDKMDIEEQRVNNAFMVEERNYLRNNWKQDVRSAEQEVTRRALETCLSVLRCPDNTNDDIKKTTKAKVLELIPKLG